MKIVQKFQAFDGVEFNSEADCRAYEKRNAHQRLVGLSIDQVEAALSGADAELADAIEILGAKIARDRRERGEMKRQRGASAETAHAAEIRDAEGRVVKSMGGADDAAAGNDQDEAA